MSVCVCCSTRRRLRPDRCDFPEAFSVVQQPSPLSALTFSNLDNQPLLSGKDINASSRNAPASARAVAQPDGPKERRKILMAAFVISPANGTADPVDWKQPAQHFKTTFKATIRGQRDNWISTSIKLDCKQQSVCNDPVLQPHHQNMQQ